MSKNKRKWNSEKMLSISAMSISFLTLVIFIYQTNLLSKQNYLSILPYLAITTTYNKAEDNFELNIENHGVGPAIIESVRVSYQGEKEDLEKYNYSTIAYLQAKKPNLDSLVHLSHSTIDRGMAIPPNTKFNVVSVRNSPADYELIIAELGRLMEEGLVFEVTYKSIQNERWRIHSNSMEPEELD